MNWKSLLTSAAVAYAVVVIAKKFPQYVLAV